MGSPARKKPAPPTLAPLLTHIGALTDAFVAGRPEAERKVLGQYFSPPEVALFMARLLEPRKGESVRLLDPGAATGVLGITAAAALLAEDAASVHLVAVESDAAVLPKLRDGCQTARSVLGPQFSFEILTADFLSLADLELGQKPLKPFTVAVGNPPYFKMAPSDCRGGTSPNAYSRFMEVASKLLVEGGQLCFIVPRSFASGFYFRHFRGDFHSRMALRQIHVFDSRRDAFRRDSVLQENIIVSYKRTSSPGSTIQVSRSSGVGDLAGASSITAPAATVLDEGDPTSPLRIPTDQRELDVVRTFGEWDTRLRHLGLEISTGPVVPFRAEAYLSDEPTNGARCYPLLWMQHVTAGNVEWPLDSGFRKQQYLAPDTPADLLVPLGTYVLVRRFSAKEEARRLTAAVLTEDALPPLPFVGLENHLNYIHGRGKCLDTTLASGLAKFLNSELCDTYFRILSGNTQVSATEMRELPLPPETVLRELGSLTTAAEADDFLAHVQD